VIFPKFKTITKKIAGYGLGFCHFVLKQPNQQRGQNEPGEIIMFDG
jgi:hypothetical protein